MKVRVSVALSACGLVLGSVTIPAADLYVAPNGTASGPGTQSQPYDLVTALSGAVGQAGDTFWLRGGIHSIGHVDTQIHGASGRPVTFRQMPGEHAAVVGSFTVWGNASYVVFRDFELYSGDTRRLSSQNGAGFSPPDLPNFIVAIQSYAPNISFINLVVHDAVRSAIYTSHDAVNSLIYGCIVYNSGWVSPDNAEGHSYYLQGSGEISDNMAFNSAGANFHFYCNSSGSYLENLTVDGNVAFGAGALQNVRPYRDWIVGVDSPSISADNIVLKNNMGYLVPNPTTLSQIQIGRDQINGSVTLNGNYWPMGIVLNNWTVANVSGNVMAPLNADYAADVQQGLKSLSANWNNNTYARPGSGNGFHLNSSDYGFSAWKSATGFDGSSAYIPGPLTGTKVFVRPNRYEPGRANIVVYNWDSLGSVSADVSSVLAVGTKYEVRNAQNFYAAPVLSGVFDGQPLRLPMTGLTVARPMAPLLTPAPTGPKFNVFVLLPTGSSGSVTPPANPSTISGLTFSSTAGTMTGPFLADNGVLSQPILTPLKTSGKAIYKFRISKAGYYTISAMVNAPDDGANSFYVNIDAPPTNPKTIWDTPITSGFSSATVSWRGKGTPDANQYSPKIFHLSAGTHKLIVRGREANCQLGDITIVPSPTKSAEIAGP